MTSPLQDRHGYAKSGTMPTDAERPHNTAHETSGSEPAGRGALSPAAQGALAEAAARRIAVGAPAAETKEIGGRAGLDPARYGDWEINGLASDF